MKSLIAVVIAVAAGIAAGTYASDHFFHHSGYAVLASGLPVALLVGAAIGFLARAWNHRAGVPAGEA